MKVSIKTFRSIMLGGAIGSVFWSVFFLVFSLLNGIPMPNAIGLPLAFLILAGYFMLGFKFSKKYPPSFLKEKGNEVDNP